MGHKTHPLGFRLGITQKHQSEWYSKLNNYSTLIQEDFKIRSIIWDYLEKKSIKPTGITNILIKRNTNDTLVNVEIFTCLPGMIVGEKGSGLYYMDNKLVQLCPSKKILLNVLEVQKVHTHANLLAELLVEQLEQRVPFRRAMKTIIENAQQENIKGIKIQIAGRVNGAEIARTEWLRHGRVPLQTMRADIDFSDKTAHTVYGILGIKIWLFKGEILTQK